MEQDVHSISYLCIFKYIVICIYSKINSLLVNTAQLLPRSLICCIRKPAKVANFHNDKSDVTTTSISVVILSFLVDCLFEPFYRERDTVYMPWKFYGSLTLCLTGWSMKIDDLSPIANERPITWNSVDHEKTAILCFKHVKNQNTRKINIVTSI